MAAAGVISRQRASAQDSRRGPGVREPARAAPRERAPWFEACAAEIRSRLGPDSFREGAWFGEGTLLLVTSALMLAARPWGEGAGAWSRAWGARAWQRARPHLDLAQQWIGDRPPGRAACPCRPRSRRTRQRIGDSPDQLLLPFSAPPEFRRHNERSLAIAGFFAAIPRAAQEQAARLAPASQWDFLLFLNRAGPAGLDLARGNLPLAFMLAQGPEFGLRPEPGASDRGRELALEKQHVILERLGFPGEKCVARMVRKLPDAALDLETCRQLRRLLRSPACRQVFGHLPAISPALLRALRQPEDVRLFGPSLLAELVSSRDPDRHGPLVADTLAMLHQLRRRGYPVPGAVPDLAAVLQLHDRLQRLLAAVGRGSARDALPAPPLPGIAGAIEPIRTAGELIREGRQMHHCVSSYLAAIRSGRYAVYRVLEPQRATVAIERTPAGWRIDQIRGPLNRSVAPATRRLVEEWFAGRCSGRPPPRAHAGEPIPDLPVEA